MIFLALIVLIMGLLFTIDFFFFHTVDVRDNSTKHPITKEHNNSKSSEYLNKILKNIN